MVNFPTSTFCDLSWPTLMRFKLKFVRKLYDHCPPVNQLCRDSRGLQRMNISDLCSSSTSCLKFSTIYWNVLTSSSWIGTKFSTNIRGSEMTLTIPWLLMFHQQDDFFLVWFWLVFEWHVSTTRWLLWNLVQMFMFPTGTYWMIWMTYI